MRLIKTMRSLVGMGNFRNSPLSHIRHNQRLLMLMFSTGSTIMIMMLKKWKLNMNMQISSIIKLFQYYLKLIQKIDNFLATQCKEFKKSGHKQEQGNNASSIEQKSIQCFMKLSTRSPKDLGYKYSSHQVQHISGLLNHYLRQKFPQYKNQVKQNLPNQFINEIYHFFLDLSKEKFKIKTGKDFIEIFSSSERIIIDVSDFSFIKGEIFSGFQKGNFQRAQQNFIQLWARQWKDFKWFEELRCFFKDYKLTAISQYDQRCYFPQLDCKNQLIISQIQGFFNQMLPSLKELGLSEGVMDLVLFGIGDLIKKDKIAIKLIEINVFNRNSRASLFNWQRDLQILQGNTQNKLQLRILNKPIQISRNQLLRLMGMVQKGTEQIIQKTMKDLGIRQLWDKFQ